MREREGERGRRGREEAERWRRGREMEKRVKAYLLPLSPSSRRTLSSPLLLLSPATFMATFETKTSREFRNNTIFPKKNLALAHNTYIHTHQRTQITILQMFLSDPRKCLSGKFKLRHFFTFTPVVCVFGDLCCDEKRSSPWRRRQCECGLGRGRRTKRRCGDCRHGHERRGTRRRSLVDSQSPVRED